MLWYICWKHEHHLKIQLRTLFVAVKHVLQLLSLNLWEIPKTTQFKADILSQCTVQCVLKTLRKKLDKRRSVGLKERCNWEEILRYDNYTRTGLRMGLLETRIQIMDRHGWRWSGERVSIHRWSTVGCCSAGAVGDLCETWLWWRTVPSTVQEQLNSVCISIFKHWDQTCVLHQSPSTERWFDLE